MLRTTGLHLLLGGIRRFSTPGHPGALGACDVALWRLPRPDLHRLADGDLQGTPRQCDQRASEIRAQAAAPAAAVSLVPHVDNLECTYHHFPSWITSSHTTRHRPPLRLRYGWKR